MVDLIATDELQQYWASSGLAHLPLRLTKLEDIRQYIDAVQYTMIKKSWPGTVIALTELDRDAFNNLVFIDNDDTTQITSGSRSIIGVTKTISKKYSNLDELFGLNDWLGRVGTIYRDFDYTQFGYLLLRVPTYKNERDESDEGKAYLEGGNHRSLALAVKTNLERYKFKPVKAIVLLQPSAQRAPEVGSQ